MTIPFVTIQTNKFKLLHLGSRDKLGISPERNEREGNDDGEKKRTNNHQISLLKILLYSNYKQSNAS